MMDFTTVILYTLFLVCYILVVIFLIGIILVQRGASDLANLGSNSGVRNRGDSNILTKTTGVLGSLFMLLALGLSIASKSDNKIGSPVNSSVSQNKSE
jgi:preprotein translocase subunit SecG